MKTYLYSASAIAMSLGLVFANPALAVGVRAGTEIQNTASASYTAGGQTQTVDSNQETITVDELLDVTVTWQDGAPIPIADTSVLQFRVTNTGNGPEAFVLTANPAVAGNDFDVTINDLIIDANNNGVIDPGETPVPNGFTTAAIAPDAFISVLVRVTAPTTANNGQTSQVDLVATAVTGTGDPGDVFPRAGEGGGDAVVGSSGADDNALGQLIEVRATVTLVKTSSVVDPFSGTQVVPGSIITYSLAATVDGSGSVAGLVISDFIPANTTYVPGSLTFETAGLSDANDTDAGQASSAGIEVAVGTLAASQTRTVTFDVTVNQ